MHNNRKALRARLVELLGNDRVYFQPPESEKLEYPCILYNVKTGVALNADNHPYNFFPIYDVLIIEKTYSDLVCKIGEQLEGSMFDRTYRANNLYHSSFTVRYPHDN